MQRERNTIAAKEKVLGVVASVLSLLSNTPLEVKTHYIGENPQTDYDIFSTQVEISSAEEYFSGRQEGLKGHTVTKLQKKK